VARLKPGNVFFSAGRQLEFVRLREMIPAVKGQQQKKPRRCRPGQAGSCAPPICSPSHLRSGCTLRAGAWNRRSGPTQAFDSAELRALEPLAAPQADLFPPSPPRISSWSKPAAAAMAANLFGFPFEGRSCTKGWAFLWAGPLDAPMQAGTITRVGWND